MDWGTDEAPLQAAPLPRPVAASTQALAMRSQQLTIGGSGLMVTATYLALAGALGTSYARHELLLAAVATLGVSIALLVAGARRSDRALQQAGVSHRDGIVQVAEPGTVLRPRPAGLLATVTMLLLIAGMGPTIWLLPGVVAARTLGHPTQGTSVSDAPPADCGRCQDRTTFRMANGVLVTTRLAGVLDPASDGPGTVVVYNSTAPGRAMSGSDYQRYWSASRGSALIAIVAVQVGFLLALAGSYRRRRQVFGTGLGHVPIRDLQHVRHLREADTWQITFADGRTVSLQCHPLQNAQIIRRIQQDPAGFTPDPAVWRALTTGQR
jgi:hypothetical protein